MKRNSLFVVLSLVAAVAVGSGADTRNDEVRALACMERFHLDRYPIGCWMWGDAPVNYDDTYFRDLKAAGFNTVLGGPDDLERVHRFGLKMMFATGSGGIWGDVELPVEKYGAINGMHYARLPELLWLHKQYGSHPDLIGYHLNDNCSVHDYTVECSDWLRKNAPDEIPWVSTNPNPIQQSETSLCLLSTQNYPFSTSVDSPEEWQRRTFCNVCDRDRELANRRNMAVWMVIGVQAHTETPSQYRFQVNASAAYGAQGVWLFAYNRHFRPVLSRAATPVHHYLADIAGPHLRSRRSVAIYHTGPDLPADYEAPAKGKLIEDMNDRLMAGILVPDDKFQQGIDAPDFVFVVDKRAIKLPADAKASDKKEFAELAYRYDPPSRQTSITFGPRVRCVWVLRPDGSETRCLVRPGEPVELPPLRGGEAVMLRIDATPIQQPAVNPRIMLMPEKWKCSFDKENVSGEQKWAAPDFDDSEWNAIPIDRHGGWGRYEGQGWYRVKFTAPPELLEKHIYLNFGAADEEATVYIDGEVACAHTRAATGLGLCEVWSRPFAFECTRWLSDGKEHTIAVQVVNYWGSGGLYKPVHLVACDQPLDDSQILKAIEQH